MEVLDGLSKTGLKEHRWVQVPQGDLRAPHHGDNEAAETQLRCGAGTDLGMAVL